MIDKALKWSFEPDQQSILKLWKAAQVIPAGRILFSRLIGRLAPYTGTIRDDVVHLQAGHARCEMREHKRIHNHLNSVHAVALVNLMEKTTGLAMLTATPPGMRGIVTHLEIDYVRKARGVLMATSHAPSVVAQTSQTYFVPAEIKDASGEIVCTGLAHWLISPTT
ncbi:MAG: DUF4442 domain-containing protein [Myxococcota bacterium]|nr:DUF4442 domain-containing protein [Myxococcota bacterium]